MSVTQADLNAFHQFALGKISNGGAESLPQLMEEWTAQTEYAQTVAAVRQGVAEGEAGRAK